MRRRRLGTALRVVVLAVIMVLLGSSPAYAYIKSQTFNSPYRPNLVRAYFEVVASEGGGVYGDIFYSSSYPLATLLSVYVAQCDGLGHNCTTISAAQTQQLGATKIQTTPKTYSAGHVWKACGSVKDTDGWHLLNVCSPPTT